MKRLISATAVAICVALATLAGPADAAAAPRASDDFAPCVDADTDPALAGSLCARRAAPLDYRDRSLGDLELFVRKFPAKGRSRGRVWLVAGGPGESGAAFYPLIDRFRAAFPGYDLMIPDHRGTGFSTRLCSAEESTDSPGGAGLEGAEWRSCFAALQAGGARVRAFTITAAANDLNGLVDRYGGPGRTWIYGVSYGTQLVLRTMVAAPPSRVDGIVLDSLVPPETTDRWDLSHRSAVVDEVGRRVLADCDAVPACRASLGGSAVGAMQAVVDDPALSGKVSGGRPKLFFGALLDSPELRGRIPEILAALRKGDADPAQRALADLQALGAGMMRFPQSPSSVPLVAMISAAENNARPGLTQAQIDEEAEAYLFTSPLPGQLLGGANLAYPRDDAWGRLPPRLPRTLIIHGDMDPKTPLAGAAAHLELLRRSGDVRLVTVAGAPHFVAFTAPHPFIAAAKTFVGNAAAR